MTPFSLDNLLEDWRKLLMLWSQTGALSRAAQKALQLSAEPAALRQLVGRWRTGDVQDLPPVQVLPASAMPNAAGAYARSTGTIYLNQDWLRGASRESVLAVLSEELGHHLDGLLNASDTPGDEGELFADVLQGVTVSKGELRRINAEDDQAVATIDGQKLEIEQAGIPFSYLYNPVGIAIDAQGNILANNDSGSSLLFSRFSSSGTLLKQVQYRGGIFDFGHLSAISNQKDIFQLQSDGDLIIINSSDLSFTGQINLKLLPVDTSSIFDISTSSLGDMGGLINPSAANTQYGDIALLERGNQQDIFVSGKSMGTFPFVMRLRYKSGIFQSCKVIVASRGTTAGGVNLTRGVAVNKQGVVLTTLPIAVGKNSPTFMDVPVSFNADYPESGAGSPQIPLRGQGASYSDGSNYVDFASQGMTTDAAGNFYVVTNSLGSVSLRAAGGTLIVLPPTLSTVRAVLTEGYSQSFTSYRDVAVDSNSNQAFVTSSTGNVIAFALPDLKPAKADFNADGRADLIMANARGGWSGIWTMNGTSPSGWTTLPYASGALPV